MKKIKVLYGYDERSFEKGVTAYLESLGYEVESTIKISKTSIHDFLEAHEDYDAAVLLEVINKSKDERVSKYMADELAMLTDNRNINIIVILSKSHYATPYMEKLYAAGITSAIFQEGRKGGATPKQIAELLIHPRSRREARTYYGLQGEPLHSQFLGRDSCEEFKNKLFDINYGETVVERFLNICGQMSRKQVLDLIRRLPDETLQDLRRYEEFYIILEELQRAGAKIEVHRPKGKLRTLDDVTDDENKGYGGTALPDKSGTIVLERPSAPVIEDEYAKETVVIDKSQLSDSGDDVPDFSEMLRAVYSDGLSEEREPMREESRSVEHMEKELLELRKWKQLHEKEGEKKLSEETEDEKDRRNARRGKKREHKAKNYRITVLLFLGGMAVLVITIGIIMLFA